MLKDCSTPELRVALTSHLAGILAKDDNLGVQSGLSQPAAMKAVTEKFRALVGRPSDFAMQC